MKQIHTLDTLRGIAAMSIVVFHFNSGSLHVYRFVENSFIFVDFFFVLSGYIISRSYLSRINKFDDLIKFQKKRFLRLYPLHLLTLFLFLVIELVKYVVEVHFGFIANNPAFSKNDFIAFVANVFLVHNWILPHTTFNDPSWSISSEFFIYAIAALCILFFKSKWYFLHLICASIFFVMVSRIWFDTSYLLGPQRCYQGFFTGMLTFILHAKYKKIQRQVNSIQALLILLLLLSSITYAVEHTYLEVILLPIMFAITILFIINLKPNTALSKALSSKYMTYLGTISYGIYMIHMLVWWFFNQINRFIIQLDLSNSFNEFGFLIIGLATTIWLSHISYKYFETKYYVRG